MALSTNTLGSKEKFASQESKSSSSQVSQDKEISSILEEKLQKTQPLKQSQGGGLNGEVVQIKLPGFINLAAPEVLKTYLKPALQGVEDLKIAAAIAQRIYEACIRSIADTKYGMAFPMNPEVLAYAMQLAKNETVLEIAGASGENAILLAFSDALRVYMNEIDPQENLAFKLLKAQLPDAVQKKLESIEGSCFDILAKKPELSNKAGLILCRNLIHFFNKQEQADFCQLLKKLLKPGGRAIFTVNSVYSDPRNKDTFEKNPDATCFTITQCLITDYAISRMPKDIIYREIALTTEDKVSCDYKTLYLYERKKDAKWQVHRDEFQQLEPLVKDAIKTAVNNNNGAIKEIKEGSVRVLISTFRLYNKENLSQFFKSQGFEVESTFCVGRDGHLVNEADLFKNGQQIGVIVRYCPPELGKPSVEDTSKK